MENLKENILIRQGLKKAQEITKKHAKTFYFASYFLPPEKKKASYSVYAICRLSDDSVDTGQDRTFRQRLEKIRNDIDSAYGNTALSNGVLTAFRKTARSYEIPKEYFNDLLAGVEMDIQKNRYRNFEELHQYCYRVAGVVGLIMLKIFGYKDKEAEKYAVNLGIAMQLTNILRDIKEDYECNRLYLPQDEMLKFKVSEEKIAKKEIDENFIELLKFQIKRARNYYEGSTRGISMISCRRCRLVAAMMKDIYAGILNSIEKNRYDVFSQRAHINIWGKLNIALKALAKEKAYEN